MGLPAAVALLPLLDFSDLTGWVVVNEFDLFIAITLAVTLLRAESRPRERLLDGPALFVVTLVAASFIASALVGLFPLSPIDGNAFSADDELFGAACAERTVVGAADAAIVRRTGRNGRVECRGIVAGLLCAVTAVVCAALCVRGTLRHASITASRVRSPELRVGGGDIHAYLVMAAPFIVAWAVGRFRRRFVAGTRSWFSQLRARGHVHAWRLRGLRRSACGAGDFRGVRRSMRARRNRESLLRWWRCLHRAAVVLPLMYGSFMRARVATSADEAGVRFVTGRGRSR